MSGRFRLFLRFCTHPLHNNRERQNGVHDFLVCTQTVVICLNLNADNLIPGTFVALSMRALISFLMLCE